MRSNSILKIATVIIFVAYITALNYGGCGGGGGGGGTTNSGSSGAQYRDPVLSPIGNRTISEGAALTFTISATDPDGDALTYTASNLPAGATFTATTKTFNWMPTYTQAGTYSGVRFRVMDSTGLYTDETISIIVTDVPVPSAPSVLVAGVISATQIDLTWTDNSTDETGFKIERKTGATGNYIQIDTVGASITSYSNTGLTEGTAYYYRVSAYSGAGNSAYSNESNATTPVIIIPPAQAATPTPANGANAVPINTSLSWAAASGATDYDVYFGPNPPLYQINTGAYAYNPVTLAFSTTYYWRVDSKNTAGTITGTIWSFTTAAPPPPPAQVTSPNPANSDPNIPINQQLGWASASGATSYDVYFGASSPPAYQTTSSNTSYNPSALSFNTLYYWRIDSNNSAGTTQGAVWSFTTKTPTLPPQVTSPTPVNNAINVSITAQLSWGSMTDTTSYDIYFGTTSPGTLLTNTVLTFFNPSVLSWSTAYYWRIDSKNTVGTTQGVVWSFTTKVPTLPAQVTSPTPANSATDVPITITQLSWASATDATSYDAYFGTTSPGTLLTNTTNTSYALSSLLYSTTYYWRIDPQNSGGITQGVIWNFITQSPPPPNAPSGLTAVAVSSTQINLSWTDNANNETGFKIERKTGAGGTYFQITTPSADAVSYSNTGLSVSTTYYYRIRASNSVGDSAYSNEASATPTAGAGTAVDDYCWVTNEGSNTVTHIQKSNIAISTTIAVGTYPDGVAVDATYCWVANHGSNNVTRIKKSDLTTTTIAVGTYPNAVAVDATYCWVTNYNSNNVTRILKSDLTTTTIAVGTYPDGVAVDGTYCWVANYGPNTVTRIKKSDLSTTTIAVGSSPEGVAVDATYVWVANQGSGYGNTVTRINKSDLSTTTIAVGSGPVGVAVDATYCWVANSGGGSGNTVTRILKSDLTKTTIAVGPNPKGVAVDSNYVWVTNSSDSTVTRIKKSDSTTTTITGINSTYSLGDMTGYAYDNIPP